MRRVLLVVGLLALVIGVVASGQTKLNVAPKIVPTLTGAVYLFSNDAGAAKAGIVLALASGFTLTKADIIAFGGGEVTAINNWGGGLVEVDVSVVPGGTLQLFLAGAKATSAISFAWWLMGK